MKKLWIALRDNPPAFIFALIIWALISFIMFLKRLDEEVA